MTVHRDKFLITEPTRSTNFSKFLFRNETLHVLDSSSVHHQEFSTVHTALVYVIQVCWQFVSRNKFSCSQAVSRPVRHIPLLCNKKSVPLQAWSGPEGSRKLRFSDFMTTAQGVGKVVSHTHRPLLPPRNSPGTHFC